MTTDVINGVPRDDLDLIRAVLEGFNPCMARDDALRTVRRLLATAQPAADGEREQFKVRYAHLDLRETPDVWGRLKFLNSHVESLWEGWQAHSAQPQPSTAALVEALESARMALFGYLPGHRNAVTDAAIEKASAALSAHKTGEEG